MYILFDLYDDKAFLTDQRLSNRRVHFILVHRLIEEEVSLLDNSDDNNINNVYCFEIFIKEYTCKALKT